MTSKFNWSTFQLALVLICLPTYTVSQAAAHFPINVSNFGMIGFDDEDDDHDHDDHDHGDHDHGDHEHGEHEIDLDESKMKLALAAAEMKLAAMQVDLESKQLQHERIHLGRIFGLTSDKQKTSFFAIMHVNEFMDEESAVPFLKSCLESAKDEQIKRTIRWKLVELSRESGNDDVMKAQLKSLILGE